MSVTCGFLIAMVVLVIIFLIWHHMQYTNVELEANGVKRAWNVLGRYENNQDAAIQMSKLHARLMTFFAILKEKYKVGAIDEAVVRSTMTDDQWEKRKMVTNLLRNYDPDALYENDASINGGTSWTTNKGDSMYMCLRKKSDSTQIEDFDISFFVLLHECAHIANYTTWGHDDHYWDVFKFILQEAQAAGSYIPVDYSKTPSNFCGLSINYNPLFDGTT